MSFGQFAFYWVVCWILLNVAMIAFSVVSALLSRPK